MFFIAVRKAASYIALGDKEGDDLANHHAMAYLSLIKSYEILQDEWLYKKALDAFNNYLKYHIFDEGWSIEYDGIDPGYLSASCSFFSKTLEVVKNKEILELIKTYSKTLKMFCYPMVVLLDQLVQEIHAFIPIMVLSFLGIDENIKYLANFSRFSLDTGNNITPDIMSDRYTYRVEEYLVTDRVVSVRKS